MEVDTISAIVQVDHLNDEAYAILYTDSARAARLAAEAGERAASIGHQRGLARSLSTRGACSALHSNYSEAERLFRKARRIYEQMGDARSAAESMNNLAVVLLSTGANQRALDLLETNLVYLRNHGDAEGIGRCLYSIGMAHGHLGNYLEAFRSFEKATEAFAEIPSRRGEANVFLGIGILHREIGNLTIALDYVQRSLALKEETGDRYGIGNALSTIGVIRLMMKEYDEALRFFQRAVTLHEEIGDRKNLAATLINMAFLLQETGDCEGSLLQYGHGIAICQEIGERRNYSTGLAGMAEALRRLGRIDEATENVRRALAIKEEIEDRAGIIETLILLGRILAQGGRTAEALATMERESLLVEQLGSKPLLASSHQAFVEIYQAMGDDRSALEAFRSFHAITAEIARSETERNVENMRLIHEIGQARTETQMYRLKSEQMQREMELQRRHLTSMAMTLVQQNEFLLSIRSEIVEITGDAGSRQSPLKRVAARIKAQASSSQGWTAFEEQFEKLHIDFVQRLSERHPSLTPTELKVCALLRLNLASKEIANLLCVTVRCAETHRYNIRRKLQIPAKTNLTTFFTNL